MKRILCLLLAVLCVFTLAACGEDETEGTENTEITEIPVDLTEDMLYSILAWREVRAWELNYTSLMKMVDDGDDENAQGYMLCFDGSMIKGEKGNLYRADTLIMNSAFSFQLENERYFYDGWAYVIYRDPSVEALNTYERYETTEEYFLSDFDGVVPTLANEAELKEATAVKSGDTIIVSVTLGDGRARDELIGDIDYLAERNGVDTEDVIIGDCAISYAIKDGKLIGYIGSFELSMNVDGVNRVYTCEKSAEIVGTNDEVESFTLPEDHDSYEITEQY